MKKTVPAKARYQLRGDTAVALEAVNPILKPKEPILVYDENGNVYAFKIGDGVTPYTNLPLRVLNGVGQSEDGGEIFNDYENNRALNTHAHAQNSYNLAIGHGAHAEGYGAIVIDGIKTSPYDYLISLGESPFSITEEKIENLWRECGKAFGCAFGDYAHHEGAVNLAIGKHSHAAGSHTIARGIDAHSEGYNTEALGQNSHAEGSNTVSGNNSTHAEGFRTVASGLYGAHSEGNTTQATGDCAHSEGKLTKATGDFSHAEGDSCEASETAAHAEGQGTKAKHKYSSTHGYYTESGGNAHFVVGKLNKKREDALFTVGNGNSSTWAKKNAFDVLTDGSAEIQTQGTSDVSVVQKQYVDSLVGDVESVLDSIIAIQEALVGGALV